jgi:hypothetical protein
MVDFKDRRVALAVGAGLALAAGLGVAAIMLAGGPHEAAEPPPASQGGLVVQTGRDDDIKLDARRPLRCFVDGKLVGEVPLSDCAKRNGVATGALDVGLDPSGALAAANGPATAITPLPPSADAAPADDETPVQSQAPTSSEVAPCWRYGRGGWRRLPVPLSLDACVRSLYAGRCAPPDAPPAYGRWGDNTLRLETGEVDISDDNRDFSTLVEQAPDCSLPPFPSPHPGL